MTAALRVDNLTKAYLTKTHGEQVALAGMSLEVERGEIFGFVGANGAGKTTTMRSILGMVQPDSGQVFWEGQELDSAQRCRIGYMPEERGLYPKMAIGSQLEYFARIHGADRETAVKAAKSWTDRLGLSDFYTVEVQTLSLGNQQRVQLAAALVHDPDLLILDEPFSGLDPVAVDVMTGVLQEAAERGIPVVFSSHQLDLVESICDRVGVASQGKIVVEGTVHNLQERGPILLEVDGAPADCWAGNVPGAKVATSVGGQTTLELSAGADDQVALRAALAAGPVHGFVRRKSSLGELFRDAVRAPEQP